jgi:hypothetical protein
MSFRLFVPGLATAFALAALSGTSRAAETKSEPDNPEEFSRVHGLFDVDLPKTVEKFKAKVTVHPHFGDFLHRDYLRIPVGVRLGISERTEINTEVESYVTHGLKKTGDGFGLDLIRLGAKHQLTQGDDAPVDTSVGFNTAFPVGRPPLDLVDGFNHFSPYVTFSKPLRRLPRLTPFVTFGTDLLWHSTVPGTFDKNQPHSDSMGISGGFFYDAGIFKYTLVSSYWTTALIGKDSRNFYSVNPSVLWQLPPALKFHAKGNWIFGVGLKASSGPDGTDLGVSAKLRGEFNLGHLFRRAKEAWAK